MHAILFDNVTKTFMHQKRRLLLRERLFEAARPKKALKFSAVDNISFELAPGDSLGLIGPNGAGKSTLLNLATGLATPDSGRLEVNGRVAALLELGAGFHPDLTGAENAKINAALMGLTRKETAKKLDEIIEFSGVRDFIDDHLRTYSSGMMVRLAFSVAVHTNPDILLIDEVIGMGDQTFYARCLDKMHEFRKQGKTMLLASHSTELLNIFCERAMWLDHGKMVMMGETKSVAEAYKNSRG
jgi:ABC-type polysaccharide/polyol phosphate transport system ATPase subunit